MFTQSPSGAVSEGIPDLLSCSDSDSKSGNDWDESESEDDWEDTSDVPLLEEITGDDVPWTLGVLEEVTD